jgi:hypothetical protein
MRTFERRLLLCVAIYAAVAIVTFGRAAANAECIYVRAEAGCSNDKAAKGFMAAAIWPLYWSWEAWS